MVQEYTAVILKKKTLVNALGTVVKRLSTGYTL